jgi:hypothetical protein
MVHDGEYVGLGDVWKLHDTLLELENRDLEVPKSNPYVNVD